MTPLYIIRCITKKQQSRAPEARRQRFLGSYEPAHRVWVRERSSFHGVDPEVVDDVRDVHADELVASAADIGFWVAWHQAGGFEALDRLGWHRTTIFRKLKRFRARFGAHPDTWNPNWITLDLEAFWRTEVDFAVDLRDGLAHPDEWPGFGGSLDDSAHDIFDDGSA